MPRGDKSSYTDKQKRMAEHIEVGYEGRGVRPAEAAKRAWATVNKMTGGGKKSGSGRGKKTAMKHRAWILAVLTMVNLAVGCKPSAPAGKSPVATGGDSITLTGAWQTTKTTATDVWANTTAAAMKAWVDIKGSLGPAADYSYARKDEFVAKARADLNALDGKMADLSEQAARVNDSAKADAQVKLQELRDQRAVLNTKLERAEKATEADWNDAKTAFKNSFDDMQNSLKQAWQWLSDKLSP